MMKRSLLNLLPVLLLSIAPIVGLAEVGRSESITQPQTSQNRVIDQLIQQLKTGKIDTADAYKFQLDMFCKMKRSCLPPVRPILESKARSMAASTLGMIGESANSAIPALILLLKDQDKDVRLNAASALGKMGELEKVIPVLRLFLNDKDRSLRLRAISALNEMGESAKSTIPALIPLLKDQDSRIRSAASEALNNIGYKP